MRNIVPTTPRRLVTVASWLLAILASDGAAQAAPFLPNPLIPIAGVASVRYADFNGDGQLDLVTCNSGTNSVSVLLGRGDGTFGSEMRFGAGNNPVASLAADLDGNGTADLAIANRGSANISVFLGLGDGTFGPRTDFPAGPSPASIAAGDFDGDGQPDLAVANAQPVGEISVLLNTGIGAFGPPTALEAGPQPSSVVVGDFNEDGQLDLAAANTAGSFGNDPSYVSIFLGAGDGTFTSYFPCFVGVHPLAVAVGDFNRDGHSDLAVANLGSGTPQGILSSVSILTGHGDGTFGPENRIQAGDGPASIVVGDFTGDGMQDLAVANVFDGLSLIAGRGNGLFDRSRNQYVGNTPFDVATADFDADGKQDLAVALTSGTVNVALGAGDGTFGVQNPVADVPGASSLASGDLNGDGLMDLVASYINGGSASVILETGPGVLGPVTLVPDGQNPASALLVDLNLDGNLDMVLANRTLPGLVSVRLGHGDGTFAPGLGFASVTALPRTLAWADLNGDGRPDLAAGGGAFVGILMGLGDGSFAPAVSVRAANNEMGQVAFSDLNGDGLQDLIAVEAGFAFVLLGRGGASFGPRTPFATGTGDARLVVADLNGDFHSDLAVTNAGSNNVSILLGRGDGQFVSAGQFGTGAGPSAIVAGDFDGDGKQDLAATNGNSHDLSVLTGHGDGTFNPERRFLTIPHPVALQVADFDGNETPDLAVGGDPFDVWLLLNQSPPAPPDNSPVANAGEDIRQECASFDGALVSLDGSASTDADSSPGTNDDIVSFEWFENYGQPGEQHLGSEERLDIVLPLGVHTVTLKVTDSAGESSSDTVLVTVVDTTPPVMSVAAEPFFLWPPNHALARVSVAGELRDLCDPNPVFVLVSVSSSEPDDAPGTGDGSTTGDIAGADLGTPDSEIELRAERNATEPGRVYQITYRAMDASGNAAPALAVVTVPRDQGHGPEPLLISLQEDGIPGMARIDWPTIPGAVGYDVIAGDLGGVRIDEGQLSLGDVRVLARATTQTAFSEGATGEIPETGTVIFYLIQSRTELGGVGYGTESAPWPRIPAACGGGCP